jgi:hypothetical protein
MQTHIPVPKGYSIVPNGQKVRKGDLVLRDVYSQWNAAQGIIGEKVGSEYIKEFAVCRLNSKLAKPRVRQTKREVITETIFAMAETAKLFPNQDPIRLAHGFLDFKLPVKQTLEVLRQLAPHFQGDNGDLIRLASGFNDLKKFIGDDIAAVVKKQVS